MKPWCNLALDSKLIDMPTIDTLIYTDYEHAVRTLIPRLQ